MRAGENYESGKFTKFVGRLRRRFSQLLMKTLQKQLILKGIVAEADWPEIENQIFVEFKIDNHFEEFKDAEILSNRLNTLNMIAPFVGKYYSEKWIKSNVLNQSEDDIEKMQSEIEEEKPNEPGLPGDAGEGRRALHQD